jgi:tetratricopeptide (TPR) repeat protein
MTPNELVALLLQRSEKDGRHILRTYIAPLDENALALTVELIKREADRLWNTQPQSSFVLAGHIMALGEWTRNKSFHALGLLARGDALRRLDRDQEALAVLDASGKEFLAIGDEVGWARTRIGRISACLQLNRTDEALRDAEKAHTIFMHYKKFQRAGQIDVNAAMICFEIGQFDQAILLFDRALQTYALQGEHVALHIARAQGNKAITLAAMGKFHEALALHEQARATFAHHPGQEVAVAREELNIAQIYAAQGHYSRALLLFSRSRAIFQQHELDFQAAEVAQHICRCLLRLNRAGEAYTLANEIISYFRTSPDYRHNISSQGHHQHVANALLNLAEAATMEGKFHEAEDLLQETSNLLEEGGLLALASIVRLQQAELYFAEGQLVRSKAEAEHVADVFAEQGALPYLARAALLQAQIAAAMNDSITASYLCDQALDIAKGQELLDLKYRCYFLLGDIAERDGEWGKAAECYHRAVQGIDEVQSRLVMDERTSFLEDKGIIYQRAIALALQLDKPEQAFIYVEKAKSRVLSDYLRNNIDIRLRAGDKAGEVMLEELAALREEQAWYSSLVYEVENETNLSDTAIMRRRAIAPDRARQEMQAREHRIEHLLEQFQLEQAGDFTGPLHSTWTTGIMTALHPQFERGTIMLEYYIADADIYIFQLSHQGIEVYTLEGVVPQLERLYSLWQVNLDLAAQAAGEEDVPPAFSGLLENGLGLLQKLYDLLLGPVTHALASCEHVIIVPYGMLHYLPFHCLFNGNSFVIEQINVSYLPSAALLELCRKRGRHIAASHIPLSNALVLGLSDQDRLPYAVHEAKIVARQLGTRAILDQSATSMLLWKFGEQCPILHIAAHGLFRLDAPNFSYIKLADGLLSTIEVFNLDLSSCSLVTLSACETGRTVIGGIDEVIGLGRGFLYAGAASLLPTLWKIDDASSAELMETFYQALLGEYSKAAALAGTQRAFIARARSSTQSYRLHPYFWAAYQLIGDPGPLL